MTEKSTALPGNGLGGPREGNPRPVEILEQAERKNLALLGAFCLFLSTVEYMIPKPLPFMRIGLANLPLMLAIDIFPFRTFMLLAAIKIAGQALITGTLFSYVFLFSLAGTAVSAVSMYALRHLLGEKRAPPLRISFIGAGTLGAMMSNVSQLLLAWFFIFKDSVRFFVPPFLASGLITGVALGCFCELFAARSQWYAARKR